MKLRDMNEKIAILKAPLYLHHIEGSKILNSNSSPSPVWLIVFDYLLGSKSERENGTSNSIRIKSPS